MPMEDFVAPPVPDESNGEISLDLAASAISWPTDLDNFLGQYEIFQPKDEAAIKQLRRVPKYSVAPRASRPRARFQPDTDWGVVLTTPMLNVALPRFNSQRELCYSLRNNVEAEHLLGHDAEAIEIIRDMLSASDRLQRYGPFLVTHLVSIGTTRATAAAVGDRV